MRIVVFDQWDKLIARFKTVASGAATEKSQYDIVRLEPKNGAVHLLDRSANNLAVSGGETTVVMPDIEPGKVRDFILRVTATGENTLRFIGAEAFEGESDALDAPGDGETCIYFFTEAAADVLLVARKIVARIGDE